MFDAYPLRLLQREASMRAAGSYLIRSREGIVRYDDQPVVGATAYGLWRGFPWLKARIQIASPKEWEALAVVDLSLVAKIAALLVPGSWRMISHSSI